MGAAYLFTFNRFGEDKATIYREVDYSGNLEWQRQLDVERVREFGAPRSNLSPHSLLVLPRPCRVACSRPRGAPMWWPRL